MAGGVSIQRHFTENETSQAVESREPSRLVLIQEILDHP